MRRSTLFVGGAISLLLAPLTAEAATITGEFWDASAAITTLAEADAVIAGDDPTATFTSSGIDYPAGEDIAADTTTLTDFLGADATTLSGSGNVSLERSVFRFTGTLDLEDADQLFSVSSDDGFRLSIGGLEVSAFDGLRSFGNTDLLASYGDGMIDFELIYFENRVETGVLFTIDGNVVTPSISVVPLPATGLALLAALGGLGLMRRRRSA